jgi:hypothetical protein
MATERVAAERGLDGDGDGEGQGVLRPGEEESAPLRGEEESTSRFAGLLRHGGEEGAAPWEGQSVRRRSGSGGGGQLTRRGGGSTRGSLGVDRVTTLSLLFCSGST